jgi:type III secretion protein J
MKHTVSLKLFSAFFLALALTGCGEEELYSNLPEREANMMIAVLKRNGIDCGKIAGAENTYGVLVDGNHFGAATEVLREYGLPRATYTGVGVMFGKTGLVSSPTEERIRFMYALSQDIASTICQIDGVTAADVHIVLPDNNPFSDINYPSSAAVFVQYRPDSNVENYASQIKNLVSNSVEGLSYEKVSLALFKSVIAATSNEPSIEQSIQSHNMQLAESEQSRTRMGVMGAILLVIVVAAGYLVWRKMGERSSKSGKPSSDNADSTM